VSPTVLVVSQPATQYPAAMFERGTSVVIADDRANPLSSVEGHKTVNYWWRLRQLQLAAARQAGEAVVLQVSNHLCGGCVSNIFLVKDGVLLTPIARGEEVKGGLPSPVLPGITRAAVIGYGAARGAVCERAMLSVQEMLEADEVFLTNSSWGVLPVVSVLGLGEKKAIGDGVPGKLTRSLREEWLAEVERAARGEE
jgi:branched-subunit amino acid aminotransferase/4-amino-4-deoxychorismate lyase